MALLTATDFLADPRFARFAGTPGIDEYLADAESDTPAQIYLDQQRRCIKLLAAHRMAIAHRSGLDNPASYALGSPQSISESPGSQSVSFGGSSGGGADTSGEGLEGTPWGLELIGIKKGLPISGTVV